MHKHTTYENCRNFFHLFCFGTFLFVLPVIITSCKEEKKAPVCTITEPVENSIIPVQQKFNFTVDASDPDGTISELSIYLDDEQIRNYNKVNSYFFPLTLYEVTLDTLSVGEHLLKAIVIDNEGLSTEVERKFTISPIKPIVKTFLADSIRYNSAIVGGQIINYGGTTISETGIYWGESTSPEVTGVQVQVHSNDSVFTVKLTDLNYGTKYYYKAYSKNIKGESFGQEINFTTNTIPNVNTTEVKFYSAVEVEIGGKIVSNGGEEMSENGIYWGTNADPEISGEKLVINQFTKPEFTVKLSGLSMETKYYYRAYGINTVGYSAGEVLTFETGRIFPKTSIVADYPFNNNANDISGNNYHGTIKGDVLPILLNGRKGEVKGAYRFESGRSSRIHLPKEVARNTDNDFSLETWIYKDCYQMGYICGMDGQNFIFCNDEETIYSQRDGEHGNNSPGIVLQIFPNRTIRSYICGVEPPAIDIHPVNDLNPIPRWQHIIMVRNKAENSLEIYLDGVLIDRKQSTLTGNTGSNETVVIGALFGPNSDTPMGYYWCGVMDMFRIWNIALTPNEISLLSKDNYLIE